MRNVLNVLAISGGYIAALIGAGFASGQEIVSFFLKYGKFSIVGVFIACLLFGLFSYTVLARCTERGFLTYADFTKTVFKGKYSVIIEYVTVIFAFMSVCVMTACAGEMGTVLFGVSKIIGAGVFTVVCGIIFLMDAKKIMRINAFLGGVIIFGIIFSCFYILRFREHQTFLNEASMVVSGVTYAGYNLLTAGSILAGMSTFIKSRREAMLSSAVSGVVLFIMITLIWGVLGIYYGKINLGEVPMLTMALRQNNLLGGFYGLMLIFAVLTTGVSNGFCIIDTMHSKIGRGKSVFLVLLCGFCLSGAGFANLINTAYRLCGYVGIAVVFAVIYNFFKKSDKSSKKEN